MNNGNMYIILPSTNQFINVFEESEKKRQDEMGYTSINLIHQTSPYIITVSSL